MDLFASYRMVLQFLTVSGLQVSFGKWALVQTFGGCINQVMGE